MWDMANIFYYNQLFVCLHTYGKQVWEGRERLSANSEAESIKKLAEKASSGRLRRAVS